MKTLKFETAATGENDRDNDNDGDDDGATHTKC